MLLVQCNKQMLACKVHFIFYFYLNHVILTRAMYCQLIANLAAASMASVKASKGYKYYS